LVDNLLAFAQMGRAALHPQQVDVHAAVVSLVRSGLVEKGAERVDWQVRDMAPVEADLAFVQIVLSNLLRNAVKFSAPRETPTIEIGSYAGTDDLSGQEVFYVKDNGVGFDMRYANKLFGVFQRLHAEEDFEGTGIGLASVHRIVERHGGRVWADSKEGEGATFFFSLPRDFRKDNNTRQETPQAAIARLAATGQLTTMVESRTEPKRRL
jgi:light-regulated signal transduction histidine kinase (bacteriophytochrome)